jgi:hypothetical protein
VSISSLFTAEGAPLRDGRKSWGALRACDGAVLLRVWRDLKFIDEAHRIYILVSGGRARTDRPFGYTEREQHLAQIRAGAPCLLVMCEAKHAASGQRAIKDYDDQLFVGGALLETPPGFALPPQTNAQTNQLAEDGATWVQLGPRRIVRDSSERV